jgi:gliding motility-associated-like protein
MTKKHLIKIVLLCVLLCQFFTRASAQYATSGTAGTNLINSVYWLTWDNATLSPTSPTKIAGAGITNGTYQWLFSPTVRITADITNLVVVAPTGQIQPYTAGNFGGDGLDKMFTANTTPLRAVSNSGVSVANGTATFNVKIKMELFINNAWTEVDYPGMVIGDAESIDHGTGADDPSDANYLANREYIQATSPSTFEWQVLSKTYPGYPGAPTSTDAQYYRMIKTHTPTTQTFKFQVQKFGDNNAGVQAVSYARGVKELDNVTMLGSGVTALAIGFVVPFDLGDGPASYGVAGSYINDFVEVDQTTGDGDFQIATFTPVALTPRAKVFIGAANVDPDGEAVSGALANNDDLVGNADESSIVPAALPDIKVNQNATITLSVPVTNNEPTAATLYGWIDFNNDGTFTPDELVTVNVPAGFSGNVALNYPSSMYTGKLKTGLLYTRLRITTSALIDDAGTTADERSFGFAADGEVEDYKLKDIIGLSVSGTVFDDGNGITDGAISSTIPGVTAGIGFVGPNQLFAYLVNKATNLVVGKATVAVDGTYAITNANTGNYTVAISTNNVAIGGTLAAVTANLPANWVPSGGDFGTNNVGNVGLTGPSNMQLSATTPGTALDIAGLKFGINQAPSAVADAGTTNINTPVTVNAAGNDFDSDGTKDITSVKLIDPTDNTAKTSVTIAGQGTYVVNTGTGEVTFTPIATFMGKATPISYTILDNFGSQSLPALISITVKPVGTNDTDVAATGTPVVTTVKANDGPSGTGTTVTPTNGAHGNTTVDGTGKVTYTPAGGFTGIDTYTYTLTTTDGVVSDPITVTITVGTTPVGVADNTTTPINTPTTTTVLANDGPDGVGATVNAGTAPVHGAIVVNPDGTVTYTPTANYIGKDTYTYTITKGGLTSAPITVTISILPVGVDDATTTPINTPVATIVKTNDGPSGTGTTVTPTNGAHGITVADAAGVVTFTPTAGYIGKDTYTYTLTTADGVVSAPITVTVSIKPVGVSDATATPINVPVVTTVKTNDGPSGTGTTVTLTNGAHGTTTVDATGNVTYTPATDYIGKDTYTYTLTTADGVVSDPITVTVSVKPAGTPDAISTPIGTPVATTVKTNDGPSATGTTVTPTNGTHGTTSVTPAGVITYTPTAGFIGTDTYTYTLTTPDGVVSDPITVTASIKPVGVNDATTTPINTPVATTVKTNDGPSATGTTVTPTNGTHGTTVADATGIVTYTPANNYIGKDTYTYTLTTADGVVSDPITVTVSIKPVGVVDAITTPIGTAVITTVKTNDGPSATGTTVTPTNGAHGTTTVDATGNITYTPATTYIGKDTYTYTLTTPDGVVSDPITVTVSIKPVGVNDATTTPINTPVATTVKTNDDVSATGTTVTPTPGAHGTTVVNGTGVVTYTPATGYVGTDTYTYTLTTADGVISDPITVTVSIKPVGVNDAVTTPINTPVVTTVTANDGPSGVGATVTPTNGAHGTTTVDATGKVTYTPANNYVGKDTYTYTLTNNGAVSDPITVTVSIKPIGTPDVISTPRNTPVTTTVTANDGPSGTGTTVTPTNGTHGTTTVDGTGKVTYTPVTGYVGPDTYTYTLTTPDGVVSDPITVTVNIKPAGVPDATTTPINTPVTTTVTANDGPSGVGATVTPSNGTHGTTTVDGSGKVTYTPSPDYVGVDTYVYTLTNGGAISDPITVTVDIRPVGTPDVLTTLINTPITYAVTGNDGPSGVGATVTPTNGTHGTTTVDGTGRVIYTPATGFNGVDTYTYTLTKGGVTSDPVTVIVYVKPVGTPDAITTPANTPVTSTITGNDGASGLGNTVIPTNGAHGTTTVDATGKVTYTPAAGYTGKDTYTYTLTTPDNVVSDPITVTVNVTPTGLPDIDNTPMNTPVTTTVKANDGAGNANATVTPTNGAHGTTTVDATGKVTYTPATGFSGVDTYTYTLTTGDGVVSSPILVTINVKPIGQPDNDQTPVNTAVTTPVKNNDGAVAVGATVTPTNGAHGTTTVTAGGSVVYTPAPGYIGTDTYTYTLTTGGVVSDPITVTINVYGASMSLSKVANNTASKAGDIINYTLVVKNTGTVALTNVTITDAGADVGSITPASIATLAAGASATVTAKHTLTQAEVDNGSYSNQATATGTDPKGNPVIIKSDDPNTTGPNDPTIISIPPAGAMSITKTGVFAANNITYTFVIRNTGNINLTNIALTDAKLGLTNIVITVPAGGLVPGTSVTYTAPVYILTQADKDAGSVTNTATGTAKDTKGNNVTGNGNTTTTVPKSPTAVDDHATTKPNQPVTISVLTNDNPGSSTFNTTTVEIMTPPTHGTVKVNSDGTVVYTPVADYAGNDSFTYRVKDAFGYYTNIATATIIDDFVPAVKVPNLFTPNGDGINDSFEIRGLNLYAQNELLIVNRWGNEVFKQSGYQNTWTGEGLNEGTYYYILRIKRTTGSDWEVIKGYVTLIRTFKK